MEPINFILNNFLFFFFNIAVHTSAYDMLLVAAFFFSSTDVKEKSGLILICYTDKFNARHCNLHRVVVFFNQSGTFEPRTVAG